MQNSDLKSDVTPTTTPARGRPRAFDRAAALEQATCLFWTKGFEATSIADLTHAMGIGAPSLYAAFQSKEALYAEALRHYVETNEGYVWAGFHSATTARDAVRSFLMDSAAALTGCVADIPRGCMVTLSSVGSEGHVELGELVRSARAVTLERLLTRLDQAVAEGEIPASTDLHALARFVQTVQNGMSILARDGASRAELEAVADVAMAGWDVRTVRVRE
ncbi:TetR/AcrR family transcriptional regulator [Rhizobium sp. AG207R]|uniref:TetR/AcrR family transcriptional regulator n=1 Tax=Rhizobium sp. AG207R TaxID=2802287 RepID=UPI001606FF81|nr:TetR/AcrR family transcriptional regulator [Rhizobium sp. AG207R]MCZ3380241.1 TetR/AcrR family transcriptional regulator [Rhizobium sp. AG207R]